VSAIQDTPGRPRGGLSTAGGKVKFAIGLIVTAVLVWAIAQQVDGARMLAAVRGLPAWALGAAALCLVADFLAKIARWRSMLTLLSPAVTWAASGQSLLASIALNNLLPLRAGDVARAFAFRGALGVGPSSIVPLLVLERLLDTAALLVLAALAMFPLARTGSLPHELWFMPYLCIAVFVGAPIGIATFVLGMRVFRHRYWALGLSKTAEAALDTVEGQLDSGHVVRLVGLTAIAWVFEAGIFCALAVGFGFSQPLLAGALACALATLSGLIPSAPGAIGTFHAAALAAVTLFGADASQGAAFAVVAHAFLWLPLTALGALCLPFLSATSPPLKEHA